MASLAYKQDDFVSKIWTLDHCPKNKDTIYRFYNQDDKRCSKASSHLVLLNRQTAGSSRI